MKRRMPSSRLARARECPICRSRTRSPSFLHELRSCSPMSSHSLSLGPVSLSSFPWPMQSIAAFSILVYSFSRPPRSKPHNGEGRELLSGQGDEAGGKLQPSKQLCLDSRLDVIRPLLLFSLASNAFFSFVDARQPIQSSRAKLSLLPSPTPKKPGEDEEGGKDDPCYMRREERKQRCVS